ncbi:UNVERIFIED_CONTAM: putative E3 ubiquitin-protein ligase ARI8 [Sesamum radiatum]|uniref:E3 ubiquitin-protein ligase ARI8 n=1 Tax=Sesamum radiatum TaxID=300843 RepID=A0AAW2TH69_SESRA
MQTALADLEWLRKARIRKLANVQAEPVALLQFVVEAWIQIVECRLILKWTYAYGYYMPQDKSEKVRFFEYLQGQAETALERLHHCAEKEMEKYLNASKPSEDFRDFRVKLANLTDVTRNYFENLVRALENNLAEVEECVNYEKRNLPRSPGVSTLTT